jgi:hypothetical protein
MIRREYDIMHQNRKQIWMFFGLRKDMTSPSLTRSLFWHVIVPLIMKGLGKLLKLIENAGLCRVLYAMLTTC